MNSFSGSLWLRLFSAVLGQAPLLLARPRLAPFVGDFEQVVAVLEKVLAIAEGQDAELDALRLNARTWDTEHDEAHRSMVRLLQAFMLRGTAEQRAAVEAVLTILYPTGLDVVTLSYAEEVGATQIIAERSKTAPVRKGLAVVQAKVPAVAEWVDRIANAGKELGAALDAVDKRLAAIAGSPKAGGGQYLQALNACRRTWNFFLSTVNYSLKAGVPEDDELRELLVGPYERELSRLKSKAKAQPSSSEQPVG